MSSLKVFVTGASGFIGSAVVEELIQHGHQVIGLARSTASEEKLVKLGAKVIRGDLEDIEALKKGAQEADGTLHLGFIHDFANFNKSLDVDEAAIKAILSVYEGTNKFFVGTGGSLILDSPIGVKTNEKTQVPEGHPFYRRYANEKLLLSYADKGVRAIGIRLPPTVHGSGDHGFIPALIGIAKKNGYAAYADEGESTWPAVHRLDAAVAYRLAAEVGKSGSVLHVIAEEGVPSKQIAGAIAQVAKVPSVSVPKEEATSKIDPFFGRLFSTNNYVSSEHTRRILNWSPKQIGLIEDIEKNYS